MPKLVLFAVCRNAIVNPDDNTVSLICVLNGLTIPGGTAPTSTHGKPFAFDWAAISVWAREQQDLKESVYELRLRVQLPDDTFHGEANATFTMEQERQQTIIEGKVLPFWEQGEIKFVLEMRPKVKGARWQRHGVFPTLITHGPASQFRDEKAPVSPV
jgi:hypothetical protein